MNKSLEKTSTNNELFVWGVYIIIRYLFTNSNK